MHRRFVNPLRAIWPIPAILIVLLTALAPMAGCLSAATPETKFAANPGAKGTEQAARPQAARDSDLPTGDPVRGRELAFSRDANCVLCHMMPERDGADAKASMRGGTLGPPLVDVGARYSIEQLRARIVDPRRDNPASIMPAYARTEGLTRVASQYVGQPILNPQQISDIVAWLAALK